MPASPQAQGHRAGRTPTASLECAPQVAEAAKKKLSVVREIEIGREGDGDAVSGAVDAASGLPGAVVGPDLETEGKAEAGAGLRVRQAPPGALDAEAAQSPAVRVPREKLEALSEPLLRRRTPSHSMPLLRPCACPSSR